jgi:hypothetical protein
MARRTPPKEEAELYRQMATRLHRYAAAIRRVQRSPAEQTQQAEKSSQPSANPAADLCAAGRPRCPQY